MFLCLDKGVHFTYYHLIQRHPQLFQGGHILDVGANIGYTADQFSKIISDGYKVFAFEPDPTNFAVLNTIVKTKKINTKVYPFQIALGENQGQVDFWRRSNSHADHRIKTENLSKQHSIDNSQVLKINLDSIDHFAETHNIYDQVRFIKIDVQGYEPAVLAGMSRLMEQSPRLAFSIEYSPQILNEMGFNTNDFINHLKKTGFKIYEIKHNGSLKKISELQNLALPKRGYIEVLFTRESF